jgi:hypothetical protein
LRCAIWVKHTPDFEDFSAMGKMCNISKTLLITDGNNNSLDVLG